MSGREIGVLAMVMFGSLTQVQLVWNMADLFMGTMAIINLVAILLLGKVAYSVLEDFIVQRRRGMNPDFHASTISGLKGAECWEDRERG
ncbi:hypothetical protein AV656_05630 [Bhargavaea cecembensis]|uniref:Uncharacterized protein n=1 Tax=Bhargavaea cecembensis TaxID=394098 RepID=A0A165H0E7_9BACL|nr:hypothetical protein AV656_05630 [Bhargavaea cecembensis]